MHLWLQFDGQALFAARGDGAVTLAGKPLTSEWTAVPDGAELRFGFGLLRVGRDSKPGRGPARERPAARRQAWLLALVVLTGAGVALALTAIRGRTPSEVAKLEATRSAAPPSSMVPAEEPVAVAPAVASPPEAAVAPGLPSLTLAASPLPAPPQGGGPSAVSQLLRAYPQNIANRAVPRIGEKPWLISEEWRAHHERQLHAPGRTTAKVLFLGDSITEGWGVAPAYGQHFAAYAPVNLGIANDMTQNVLWRIEHGTLSGTNPRAVVLMIGVNNLAGGFSPEQTADGVRAILTAIQAQLPAARVLLLGVLPARQDAQNPLRLRISQANQLLLSLAKPDRVEVRDLGSLLLEPDGSISRATMRDFLHPSPEGFERLSLAVAPYLQALVAAPPQ